MARFQKIKYPGIKQVEHVYFYSVRAVGPEVRRGYLQDAYRLGREYACLPEKA